MTDSSPKRLYRDKANGMLYGVCAGLGEYFNLDPTIIRLLFVIFSFVGATGIAIYIIAAIVVPEKPQTAQKATSE